MHEILYLHGFGTTNPGSCRVAEALRRVSPEIKVLAPCYHPAGRIEATRIGASLDEFAEIIFKESTAGKVHLVGYSFGGLLAALLAARRPGIIENVLLMAPAIDNFARNYEGRDPATWRMPRAYVDELQTYPARPEIVRPTTLVHGMLDDDRGGSAPWRVERWQQEQAFHRVYLLEGVGHSLEPWLSKPAQSDHIWRDVPGFEQLVSELLL